MLFESHAKFARKVSLSLARRGFSADAALFKECALFCEFLVHVKSLPGSSCWAEYRKLLKKFIKNTQDACMRHKDIPVCADYMVKNKEFKGGCFSDLSENEAAIYAECMNDERVINKDICCKSIANVRETSGYTTAQSVFADRVQSQGGRKRKQ